MLHYPKLARVAVFATACILSLPTLLSASNAAVEPEPRLRAYPWMSLARWYQMHSEDVALAEAGDAPLVFLGDSITEGWAGKGRSFWDAHFAPLGAVNFGIGGDMTQNVLWRLDHGSTGALDPKAVVLLIGINNFGLGNDSPEAVIAGIKAVVAQVKTAFPHAQILLHAVFPSGAEAGTERRQKTLQVNAAIAALATDPNVDFLDLWDVFLESDSTLSAEIMPDFLHLSEEGYRRWTKLLLPWVEGQLASE